MLAKLMKYDFKSMLRIFVPLWISLLVVSIVNRFTIRLSANYLNSTIYDYSYQSSPHLDVSSSIASLIAGCAMFLFFALIIAMFVIATIIIVQRFYTGLLRDEGYLMFTLPVSPGQLILSKGLAALVLLLINCLVALLAVVILAAGPEASEVIAGARMYMQDYTFGRINFLIFLYIIAMIAGITYSLSMVYASMALGHLAKRHRILLSFAAYIGISWAISIFTSILSTIAIAFVDNYENWFTSIINDFMYGVYANDYSGLVSFYSWALAIGIFCSLLLAFVFFLVTRHILSKKLNLE